MDLRPVFIVHGPGVDAAPLATRLAEVLGVPLLPAGPDPVAPVEALRPERRGWDSARLVQQDARPRRTAQLAAAWRAAAGMGEDVAGIVVVDDDTALRVPFLAASWPGARFVHVEEDPDRQRDTLVAAWHDDGATRRPGPDGWDGPAWTSTLAPGWRSLAGRPVEEVAEAQAATVRELLERDLESLPVHRVHRVVAGADPAGQAEDVAHWLHHSHEHDDAAGPADPAGPSPLRSSSTGTFSQVLRAADATAVVTTYQSGYLVLARAQEQGVNTHFRKLPRPMGTAYRDGLLTVGCRSEVVTFADVPQAAPALPPRGTHDACFVPRHTLHTGDIRVHDLAWAQGMLWAVATRFSCLVTFDGRHSFVPRWKPSFISEVAPEDRCHLNGMAVVDDRVRYVTALGTSDTAGGWREGKERGGVVIDVDSDEVVAAGLSMPHSPTWHDGALWVLESGDGSLARVDLGTGRLEKVAELPGFTRGLAFAGQYAFVGLSEVREANLFGGLPLTARLEERECGVWVVDTTTGRTVAWLKFEDAVQEIYDVSLLPGIRFPEILDAASEVATDTFLLPPPRA